MNPFASLLNLFIPRECHLCNRTLLDEEQFVCEPCLSKLPVTFYEMYWLNKSGINTDLNPMEQRFAGQLPLNHACAPFFYSRDSSLASLFHDFKYRGFSKLAVRLGSEGTKILLPTGFFDSVDLILPIPLHWTKKWKRGYNQSEMIAKGISSATGIPVDTRLRARRPHRTQTSLSAEQRMLNTRGIFEIRDTSGLDGKHILLVDDVCTTGATLLSAGEAIAASVNNVRISIFTLGVV